MPRRPRNGLVSPSTVKPGDRLVAAGIERADGHRLAARPFERCGDRPRTALLVRQAGRPWNRNSVRTRPMPSQIAGSSASSSRRVGDVDHAPRSRSPSAVTAGLIAAPPGVAPCRALRRPRRRLEALARRSHRAETRAAPASPSSSGLVGRPSVDRAEADDHRHAARARQHGDMAGGLPARERDAAAAAPVDREEARRRQVVAEQDRALPASVDRRASPVSAREHAVAQVAQIGGAGAEILVVGRLVVGDLRVQRLAPGASPRRRRRRSPRAPAR